MILKKIWHFLTSIVNYLGSLLYTCCALIFGLCPIRIAWPMAYLLFFLFYPIVGLLFGLKRRVVRNLLTAYGKTLTKREAGDIAYHVLLNQTIFFLELFFIFTPKKRETFKKLVTVEGLEHLEAARKNGRGAIGVSAHLGNFQLLILRMAIEDDGFVALIKTTKSEIFNTTWNYFMDVCLLKRIMMKNRVSATKEIVREIRQSAFMLFIADEFTRRGGHAVTFFGKQTLMAAGPAQLALRLKVPLLPTFIIKGKKGRHRIIIEKPIEFTPTGNFEADSLALTQKRVDILEKIIRQYPDQWLWTQSRWKKRRYGKF